MNPVNVIVFGPNYSFLEEDIASITKKTGQFWHCLNEDDGFIWSKELDSPPQDVRRVAEKHLKREEPMVITQLRHYADIVDVIDQANKFIISVYAAVVNHETKEFGGDWSAFITKIDVTKVKQGLITANVSLVDEGGFNVRWED